MTKPKAIVVREPTPKRPQSRHRRGELQRIYDAVVEEFSVPELQAMLRQTWQVAEEKRNSNDMLRVLQFVMDYAVGKPVQRSVSASFDVESLRSFIRGDTASLEEEEGEEAIDLEQE